MTDLTVKKPSTSELVEALRALLDHDEEVCTCDPTAGSAVDNAHVLLRQIENA